MIKMSISTIKLITDLVEIRQLYGFIRKYPLEYPNYDNWIQQCYEELCLGTKNAFVCKLEGVIIGDLVFQRHKKESKVLEIKNLRVEQQYQRRRVASRLLKNIENFARSNLDYKRIVVDTHANNLPAIQTFQNSGFVIVGNEELYNSRKEVILAKDLD
jgi:ribosomal protein S18 acetylase RimI-like enzyme